MNKVAIIGDCAIDNFVVLDNQDAALAGRGPEKELCFRYGEKIAVESAVKFFGGSALNVSAALAGFELETSLCSVIGSDFDGREIIEFLSEKSVNIDHVEVQGETNQSFILLFKGERTVLSYHKKRDYSKVVLPKSDLIYLSSMGCGGDKIINKIRAGVHAGAKLVFNPGSYELSAFDLFKPLVSQSAVFIVNRQEAQLLSGKDLIKDQLAKLASFGTKVVVITDSKNGAYFATEEGNFHMNPAPAKVIDATGAGDAFSSGLVAGLLKGKSLEESAAWGMLNSASIVEELGSNSNLLTTAQIDKQMKDNKILKFSRITASN